MFIVNITYKKDLSQVEAHLEPHINFLNEYYQKNIFLLSGRKQPRTGGVILACADSKTELEKILQQDPFYQHGIADYDIMEFAMTQYHPQLHTLLETL